MWTTRTEELARDCGLRVVINLDASPVRYADVLRRWQSDAEFRSFFIGLLAASPYEAFRWETPPITVAIAHRAFEFVLLDSPGLARQADPAAFADQFGEAGATDGVVAFPNLGRDAILVVPCQIGKPSWYGHLAAFSRHAPEAQQHALWARVGREMEQRVGAVPVWLSTAGAGVPWLHVRLDDRSKYYGHAPYRESVRSQPK